MEIYKIYRKFKVNKFTNDSYFTIFFKFYFNKKNVPKFSLNRNFVDIVLLQNIYQGLI